MTKNLGLSKNNKNGFHMMHNIVTNYMLGMVFFFDLCHRLCSVAGSAGLLDNFIQEPDLLSCVMYNSTNITNSHYFNLSKWNTCLSN